jgi:hypothetical protein
MTDTHAAPEIEATGGADVIGLLAVANNSPTSLKLTNELTRPR